MHLICINHRMQAYAPGAAEAEVAAEVAAAAEVAEEEVAEVAEEAEAVEAEAAFRRIDKNPTYFYDRIMGIVTETGTVVIPLHHLFRILSTVLE